MLLLVVGVNLSGKNITYRKISHDFWLDILMICDAKLQQKIKLNNRNASLLNLNSRVSLRSANK